MAVEFIEEQRFHWKVLSYLGFCRHIVQKNENGKYKIQSASPIGVFFYYFDQINFIIKFIYLVLCYKGYLGEVHFLDQMAMWDWYLISAEILVATLIWYSKYPVFEVMYQNWTLQEKIYRKLGCPKHISNKIRVADRKNKWIFHSIVTIGTLFLGIQSWGAPKEAVNTYAFFKSESQFLRFLFAWHEMLAVHNAYQSQIGVMLYSSNLTHVYSRLLRAMNQCLYALIEQGKTIDAIEANTQKKESSTDPAILRQERRRASCSSKTSATTSIKKVALTHHHHHVTNPQAFQNNPRKIKDYLYLDPEEKAAGTEYKIIDLLQDYKAIGIAMDAHNAKMGALMGPSMGADFAQFTSDVFMMIQLGKEPETDFAGIAFYMMDMIVGVIMIFRMFILVAKMTPESEEFIHGLRTYSQYNTPIKSYLLKNLLHLRVAGPKVGGDLVSPRTVPDKANVLINWYAGAAMWKRPQDRLT